MTNELDSFLEGIDNEPKDVLEEKIEDPFKQEEVKDEVEEEEKPLPFHKDPKVQKFIDKEISKRMAEKPTETERFVKEATTTDEQDEILASLTEIVGNDTPQKVAAVNRLRKALASEKQQSVDEAIQKLQTISQQEQEAESRVEQEAEEELDQGFESIQDQFGVDLYAPANKKTKDDFIDFVIRVAPKDKNGEVVEYPDFQETYKLFKDTRKTNSRAKELSNRSMTRSNEASSVPATGDKSWKAVDKMFSNLKG